MQKLNVAGNFILGYQSTNENKAMSVIKDYIVAQLSLDRLVLIFHPMYDNVITEEDYRVVSDAVLYIPYEDYQEIRQYIARITAETNGADISYVFVVGPALKTTDDGATAAARIKAVAHDMLLSQHSLVVSHSYELIGEKLRPRVIYGIQSFITPNSIMLELE